MFSPSICHIDHQALRHNLRFMGPVAELMPVIKSNAYGHGLLPVARTLQQEGVSRFAVGTVAEGQALRQDGIRAEIVTLLGASGTNEMAQAKALHIFPLVHSAESLHRAAAQGSPAQPMPVVIKQETGMARLGFSLEELPHLLEHLRGLPQVLPVMLLSHLACADMPEKQDSVNSQAKAFLCMYTALREIYPQITACLNNSAGILAFPQLAYSLSRPGIALYGYNPFSGTAWAKGPALHPPLRPVMSVSTRILQVRTLAAHSPVSYGESFVTPRDTRIAVLAVGYADGFSRGLSNTGQVVIHGKKVPIVGRVCMGMCMVDVGDLPPQFVKEGDEAWLLGGPGPESVSAEDIAALWGTIPYEVLCLLGNNRHEDA